MIEWWNAYQGNLIGAIGGSALGVVGGTVGAMSGVFAPRGRFRGAVLGSMLALAAAGAITLIVGIVAVATGQPYHVWYPLVLIGGILTLVLGTLIPVVRARYRQAEQRRMSAAELRRG